MTMKTLGSQWAYIVEDLKVLVAFQQRKIRREYGNDAAATVSNITGLSILEYSLNQAMTQHRKARFAFWKSPVVATSQLQLNHLLEIKQKLKDAQLKDGVSREGEFAVLNFGIERIMNKLTVTDPRGQRTLIPGYRD